MGMWAGIRLVAQEIGGIGVQRRLFQVILWRTGQRTETGMAGKAIMYRFMWAASIAVTRFGPAWAKKEFRGRPVGVWMLLVCWLISPALVGFPEFLGR